MSTLDYTIENGLRAVHVLATHDGSLRQRFQEAEAEIVATLALEFPSNLKTTAESLYGDFQILNLMSATPEQLSLFADQFLALVHSLLRFQH